MSDACKYIARHFVPSRPQDFLGPMVTLVPMPRSSLVAQNFLWPSRILAEALVKEGLGRDCQPLLHRMTAVRKSSTASPGERPGPEEHYESFRALSVTSRPRTVTVVDDVMTRGATMLAAVSRLRESLGDVSVRGFAFVRTTSFDPVTAIAAPALCKITFAHGVLRRNP